MPGTRFTERFANKPTRGESVCVLINLGSGWFRGRYSADKLRHPRSDAYSAQQVLLNMQ